MLSHPQDLLHFESDSIRHKILVSLAWYLEQRLHHAGLH
jgi:hypothetical protein